MLSKYGIKHAYREVNKHRQFDQNTPGLLTVLGPYLTTLLEYLDLTHVVVARLCSLDRGLQPHQMCTTNVFSLTAE